jgi:hypothetical protein
MKKGTQKVNIWTAFDFDLIGTDVCYILAFYRKGVRLEPEPIKTANGLTIRPGDVIMHLGGEKTSAGFSTIWFDDYGGLIYEGTYTGLDGVFICFSQIKYGMKVIPIFKNYKTMYFAFIPLDLPSLEWMFTNQAGAGRLVETTKVKLRKEPYNYDI